MKNQLEMVNPQVVKDGVSTKKLNFIEYKSKKYLVLLERISL